GFFLSHTSDVVDVPDQKAVDAYLPPFKPRFQLTPKDPHTFNIMADPSMFINFKHDAQQGMDQAKKAIARADREFKTRFGRGYGYTGKVRLADAEVVLLTMGTVASTALEVVDTLRKEGKKVGLCRLRMFRPFPVEEVGKLLSKAKKVAVLDRDNSLGAGGIVAQELKAALFGAAKKPKVFEFIGGLGGKDITPEDLAEIFHYTISHSGPDGAPVWMGLKK
ncbi:MAG TPA: transketolase C-terminal domain-containing protein, partial [Candidatus Acidoferrum sp.]|nr:transketolase C-terminal domain-containing protein [Candidatus Acidoferrum sp.]